MKLVIYFFILCKRVILVAGVLGSKPGGRGNVIYTVLKALGGAAGPETRITALLLENYTDMQP